MQTTLAERLKLAMSGPPKKSGKALAAACGVKPPSVSDWLSGKSKTMEGSNLIAAADFLNVRPRWLADGVGPMNDLQAHQYGPSVKEPTVAYFPDPKPDQLLLELVELFGQLDTESKREYLANLRGFVAGRRPHLVGPASAIAG